MKMDSDGARRSSGSEVSVALSLRMRGQFKNERPREGTALPPSALGREHGCPGFITCLVRVQACRWEVEQAELGRSGHW